MRVKRVYELADEQDGYRVLVDRLWPRGISKEAARIDLWARHFAPSAELRSWYHEDPSRHDEFAVRYQQELQERRAEIEETVSGMPSTAVTLITATKYPDQGHVPILLQFLETMAADT